MWRWAPGDMYKVRDMSMSYTRSLTKSGSLWIPLLGSLAPSLHPPSENGSYHSEARWQPLLFVQRTKSSTRHVSPGPLISSHHLVTTPLLPQVSHESLPLCCSGLWSKITPTPFSLNLTPFSAPEPISRVKNPTVFVESYILPEVFLSPSIKACIFPSPCVFNPLYARHHGLSGSVQNSILQCVTKTTTIL